MMEVNGKTSAGKIIQALVICYFFITEKFKKVNLQIKYCPTDQMWRYLMTKPTQGAKFRNFRNYVLGGNE